METHTRRKRAAATSSDAAESHVGDDVENADCNRSHGTRSSSTGSSPAANNTSNCPIENSERAPFDRRSRSSSSGICDNSSSSVNPSGNRCSLRSPERSGSFDSRSSSEGSGSDETPADSHSNSDCSRRVATAGSTPRRLTCSGSGLSNSSSVSRRSRRSSRRNSWRSAQDTAEETLDFYLSEESEAVAADVYSLDEGPVAAADSGGTAVVAADTDDFRTAGEAPEVSAAAAAESVAATSQDSDAAAIAAAFGRAAAAAEGADFSFDVEDDTHDVDAALGLHAAADAAADVEEQQQQQQERQEQRHDTRSCLPFSVDCGSGRFAPVGSSCKDDAAALLPPHPCLPPPIISSLEPEQQPSAATPHSPIPARGAASPPSHLLGSRHVGPSPATALSPAAPRGGAGTAAGGDKAGGRRRREEQQQEQQVWQKVRQLLRRRHLQLQQLEVVGWLAWLRFIHREVTLATRLIAAAALDAYLNFCCRKAAAAAEAAAARQGRRGSVQDWQSFCCPQSVQQRRKTSPESEEPAAAKLQRQPQRQQQQQAVVEPRYPADGAAAFAFIRETFQVETLPNNHPFFLPLRHPQQRYAAAVTARQRRRAAARAAAAAGAHPLSAAAAAARAAQTAGDAAFLAKLAVTRHHALHNIRGNDTRSATLKDGSGSSADSRTESSGVRSRSRSSGGAGAGSSTSPFFREQNGTSHARFDDQTTGRGAAAAAVSVGATASAATAGLAMDFSRLQQQQQQRQPETTRAKRSIAIDSLQAAAAGLATAAAGRSTRWPRGNLLAFGGGALRFRLLRAIERKRGTDAMLAIIFVVLCRSLGVRARLVLSLPSLAAAARLPAAASPLSATAKLFLTQSSGGHGRSSGAAVAAAAAAQAAGMSCCSDAPPGWLVRLFLRLGLPLPAFLRVHARHYRSPCLLSYSDSSSHQLSDTQHSDSSTGWKRNSSSSSSTTRASTRVPEDDINSTCGASWNSSGVRGEGDEAAGAAGATGDVEDTSGAAALRAAMCAMPQQLQVWGEYFCRQEERWIACTFFSSSLMIHDAADMLAGRTSAVDAEARGAPTLLGGAATRTAPRAPAAAARLKRMSSKRLAAFLGISTLFLDTSSRAAGAPRATGLATGEAAAKASRVAVAACGTSASKTAPGQQRTAARAVCDFLPTIKERWQPQQQQPAAESLQSKLQIGELQAEERRGEQQRKAWQACQQQGAEAAKVHPNSGAKKKEVVEEAAAAATPQVQLGQLLLFTRPRRSQESAARDRRGEASDSSAAARYRTAAGRSRRKTALTAAASSFGPERRALPDSPDSSTSPSESPTRSLCRGGEERGEHRQLREQQQQQGQDQQQENPQQHPQRQRQPQREQQLLHRGLRRQPEKLLQVEPEDQHSAEDEQGTRVASSPRAEGRRSRVNPQVGVKDVENSAFLCCFPVVVELPPLLFFFHSPRNLSIIVFPFSVVTAAPTSAPRGGRTPETSTAPRLTGAAAERTCGSRSAAEVSGAAAHDFVNEHKASSRDVADKRVPTAISTCSSTGERCCDAAVRADASSLSEGAFSFARGQVFTFSIPRPRPTAETASSSALAAAQSLPATAAGTGLLQALQIRMESVPPPLPSLSGAATASRGAAAAVLLVVLLLLKLLQLQGFFNVAPAVVAFVREAAKRVLLTEAASAADGDAEEGGRRTATGAGNSAAAKREDVSVSTQHLQQQQLQQQQVQQQQLQQQQERILQHFKFPFEVEEERYILAAELSAAWRKAASSSSSSAATARRARSARSSSDHRSVQPVLQQHQQRSDRGAGSRSNSGSRRSVNQGSSSRGSSEERYFQFSHTGLTSRSPSSRRSGSPPPVETAPTSSASRTTSTSSPASARSGRDLSNSRSSSCSGMTAGGNITAASHALASARFGGAAASRERLGIDFIRATRQRGSRVAKHVSPPFPNMKTPPTAFPSSALVGVQSTSAAAGAPCSAARSHVAAAEATETRSAAPPEAPPAATTPGSCSRQPTLSTAAAAADLGVAAAAAVAAARSPGVGDRPACAAAATAAVAAEVLSARDVIIVPSEDEEEDEAAGAAAAVVDAAGGAAGGPASIPQQPPNPAAVAGSPAAASSRNRDSAASPAAAAAPFFAAAAGPLAAERQFVLAIDETERVTDVSFRYTSSWRRVLEGRQRRLQHWWTSAGTQRLLLPKQQQQQRGERRKRQKQEHQEQQQQQHQEPTGSPEGQTKVRRRDDVLCTSEAAAAERKEVEELRSGSSSESSVPKTSRGNRSEEEEEEEQERQTTEAEEDFIVFEDEDVGKSHVPQGQQEPQNLDNGGGEGAAAKEEEAATSCRRTDARRRISSAAERSESGAGEAAAEPVLGRTGRADKVEEEEEAAEEIAKEQQQEEEEATRRAEERERQELLAKEPLPTSRAGFKLHPKFVLSSDLKPFEYIPPGTRPAAFFGGELVFLRADVRVLKSERQWLRLRRKVKTGEGPLRIVTRRIPQLPAAGGGRRVQWLNPLLQQMDGFGWRDAQNSSGSGANPAGAGDREKVGLYAEWQTEVLPPLRVENGVLPVNEKGNIEVGKLGAVPIGAVHISLEEFCCEGEERSGSRASERRSSSTSSSRKQRTCLSAGSLGGALTAAAAACGVQWAPAVVGFELDTKRQLQQQARWVVQRDGIVVLKDDEARVRQQWAEERIRREKVWQQRRQRREQRDREEAAMRWRVLCRALLYWREQQQREEQRQRDQQEHP